MLGSPLRELRIPWCAPPVEDTNPGTVTGGGRGTNSANSATNPTGDANTDVSSNSSGEDGWDVGLNSTGGTTAGGIGDSEPPRWRLYAGTDGSITAKLSRSKFDETFVDINDPLQCRGAIRAAQAYMPGGWPMPVPPATVSLPLPKTTYSATVCADQPMPTYDDEGGSGPWQVYQPSLCNGGTPGMAVLNLDNHPLPDCENPVIPMPELVCGAAGTTVRTYEAWANTILLEAPPTALYNLPPVTSAPTPTVTVAMAVPTISMPSGTQHMSFGQGTAFGSVVSTSILVGGLGLWYLGLKLSAKRDARRTQQVNVEERAGNHELQQIARPGRTTRASSCPPACRVTLQENVI